MIGNSLETDVHGALACGMDAVLLDRDGRHVTSDVRTIRTLDDLDFRARDQ